MKIMPSLLLNRGTTAQLQAPAALLPGKEPPVAEQEAG
jgi:hypothetical protein